MQRDLVFIDTETTGFSPGRHEIIDLWAVRTTPDLELISEAGGYVRPERIYTAHKRALYVNGYNPQKWEKGGQRSFAEVWKEARPVILGAQIVGSNPAFDIGFLNAAISRHCPHLEKPLMTRYAIDIATLAQPLKRRGVVSSVSLDVLTGHFGIDGDAHTARGDVYRTIEVYRRLMMGLRWVA